MMNLVKREFPKAKRERVLRTHKHSQLQATRDHKKTVTSDRDTDTGLLNTFNIDILQRVFKFLHPPDLASAMCVCKDWADAASADVMWSQHTAHLRHFPLQVTSTQKTTADGELVESDHHKRCDTDAEIAEQRAIEDDLGTLRLVVSHRAAKLFYFSSHCEVHVSIG